MVFDCVVGCSDAQTAITDPPRVDRSTPRHLFFSVPPYIPTWELRQMSRDALPYPPRMRNGGSSPAHFSSSYLSDPSWWLQFKRSQPPPHAPEWLFDYYECYNPLANVGRPLRDKEWHQQAIRKDQQAAGLLPPGPRGGPILHGAHPCVNRAYRDWKAAINDLWADKYEVLLSLFHGRTSQEARFSVNINQVNIIT